MTDRLIRLMRIITLVQAKPGILARELAERCGTSERTIYRDMDALSAMHIPVTHQGHGKGYRFIGDFALYPLDWTEEETSAFAALPSIMNQIKPILPAAFESAYEKVMAANHKRRADSAATEQQEAVTSADKSAVAIRDQPPFLIPILMATLSQHTIQAEYVLPDSRERKSGRIDPYWLVPWKQRFYLVGRSHSEGNIQIYRLSNFQQVEVLDDVFVKVHTHVQQELLDPYHDQHEQDQVQFKIRITPRMANMFRTETFIPPMRMAESRDGSLIVELCVTNVVEFISWLSQYGAEAEIMEPVFYREMMKRNLRKWLALYK
ncbi:YafY family protein [Paenibacillus sp. XY044]|uniref:helix-turn-helix transcriptional regulator n=1 Tax=Paenibacillus sp. XY044 TaxID=2026089 RepID=UPI000B97CCD6|nr:WYL domain-containing protein [Paenibacillus sp. XY044]OZB90968.1 hypothetical protein CJP46_29625 [Paenibacillus sp. XY044]